MPRAGSSRHAARSPTCHTVVVGAGPAGLLAALRAGMSTHDVLLVDHGQELHGRSWSHRRGRDEVRTVTSGFGGAALYSHGRLRFPRRAGTTPVSLFAADDAEDRHREIEALFCDGERPPLRSGDPGAAAALSAMAHAHGLEFVHRSVHWLNEDRMYRILLRLRERVSAVSRILCETRCMDVRPSPSPGARWEIWLSGATGEHPYPVHVDNVVLAPGRGAEWLSGLAHRLDLPRTAAQPEFRLHLEGPRGFLDPLLKAGADPLLVRRSPAGATARACGACVGGDVAPIGRHVSAWSGTRTNGRSRNRSHITLLARGGDAPAPAGTRRPSAHSPPATGADVAGAAADPMAQALGDFLADRPTTGGAAEAAAGFDPSLPDAATGSLSAALARPQRHALQELIVRMARLSPQVLRARNVLYGLVAEGHAARFEVTGDMEVPDHPGLFLAGDGSGLTEGIIEAAESGWIAGETIAAREQDLAPVRVPASWRRSPSGHHTPAV